MAQKADNKLACAFCNGGHITSIGNAVLQPGFEQVAAIFKSMRGDLLMLLKGALPENQQLSQAALGSSLLANL
jgi:hypothetical protein